MILLLTMLVLWALERSGLWLFRYVMRGAEF